MNTSASSERAAGDWLLLDALPDPIGYGGMAAGVIDGRLVAAGGTQWSLPIWREGTRKWTDEIFVLDAPDRKWRVSSTRLPVASGHFACAAAGDAIYLVGGTSSSGCLATAYELRAERDHYVVRRLADLPHPKGYAAGAIESNRFFLIGGVSDPASTQPSNEVWSLDLASSVGTWEREADLPGPGLMVPAAAADRSGVFAFGGMSFDAAGKPVPSAAAYCLSKSQGSWERLPDLPQPRVAINSPCPVLADGSVWLIGGYAEVWGGKQREHPGFSASTYRYCITSRAWLPGPRLPDAGVSDRDASGDPGPLPMIAAPVVRWRDQVVVIGGEVRVSTRSPAVIAWPLDR